MTVLERINVNDLLISIIHLILTDLSIQLHLTVRATRIHLLQVHPAFDIDSMGDPSRGTVRVTHTAHSAGVGPWACTGRSVDTRRLRVCQLAKNMDLLGMESKRPPGTQELTSCVVPRELRGGAPDLRLFSVDYKSRNLSSVSICSS